MRAAPPDVRAAGASLACVCAALPGADCARAELGGETLAPPVLRPLVGIVDGDGVVEEDRNVK